jgi:hypothetical protein
MQQMDDPAATPSDIVEDEEADVDLFQHLLGATVVELWPPDAMNVTRHRPHPPQEN